MRLAITSMGETLESPVDPRFGRARYFVVYDFDNDRWDVVDNASALNAAQGAGIEAAQRVVGTGAEGLATGHCGPKAFAALRAAGITVFVGAAGTIRDVVDRYRRGALEPATVPDVDAHSGGGR